jgi:hypothetical protein
MKPLARPQGEGWAAPIENAPVVGATMAELIIACEQGSDTTATPAAILPRTHPAHDQHPLLLAPMRDQLREQLLGSG